MLVRVLTELGSFCVAELQICQPDGPFSAPWRFCVSALNLFPKAMLKPSHSKRCRDCRAPPNRAKRLECGAFTAAFARG